MAQELFYLPSSPAECVTLGIILFQTWDGKTNSAANPWKLSPLAQPMWLCPRKCSCGRELYRIQGQDNGFRTGCPLSPRGIEWFFLNLFDSKFKRSYFDSLTFYFPQMKMLPGDQSPLKRCFLKTHFYISNQVKNGGFSLTLESCLTVKVSFKEDLALIFQGLLIHIHKTKHGLWNRAPAIRVPSFCYLLIASPWEVP